LDVDFVTSDLNDERLPLEIETTLYRIAQEALVNIARHAEADHVTVHLKRRQGSVVLVVEDDGKGFDPQEVLASRPKDKRLGLYGMEERASLVGGRLTVESQPGAGTIISVDIPLEVIWTVRETTE
jgi:signal transduction histidine kinase